ncbi:MAG: Amino acid transporter, permease protein, partial [Rhodoferax sp.]|nr:Amino acid transporter, permease protein [Rhodoferax sp.]
MDLDFSPVWAGWPELLRGAAMTVQLTACALVLGCVLGLLVGIGRLD